MGVSWFHSADWGTVPAWLGAGSLLLAFRVFLQDRRNAEREQVDSVGAWASLESTQAEDGQCGTQSAVMRLNVRNGSDLPVDIVDVKYGVAGRLVNSAGKEFDLSNDGYQLGISPQENPTGEKFRPVLRRIPPEETWASPHGFDITFKYPNTEDHEKLHWDIHFIVLELIVIDNAGRVWRVRPSSGFRAREIRWYNRKRLMSSMWWKVLRKGGIKAWGGYRDNVFAAVWNLRLRDYHGPKLSRVNRKRKLANLLRMR
ncbi:hypothetical protein [Streptomyces sp. NPDC052015]|uniref:hypothetical protein n=1 Tax=Streptomyces sp. NPDC052015 TaxID=3154755 RepID=UPI0034307F39